MASEEEEDTSALLHTRERERNDKKMTTTMADLHQEPSDSGSGSGSDPNSDSDAAAAAAEDEEEAQAPHHQSIFLDPTKDQPRIHGAVGEDMSLVVRVLSFFSLPDVDLASKDNWPHVDLGYKIKKPKLRRKPGRPRNSRIKSFDEATITKKRKPCSECGELGHIAKYCQGGPTASQKRNRSSSQNESSSQASIASGRGRGRRRGSASASAGPGTEGAEGVGTEGRGRGRGGRLAALLGIV